MSIIEDARRYQYLRDHVGSVWAESIGTGGACDAAVDAAIADESREMGYSEPAEAAAPTSANVLRAIALLAKEKHCGHRATLIVRWTEGSPYEINGFEARDPVYPLTIVLEIVK